MRRWHHDDRKKRNSAETYNHPNAQNRARRANDRARSADASDLFAHGAISSAAFASARRISRQASDCAEHVEAFWFTVRPRRRNRNERHSDGLPAAPLARRWQAVQAARLTRAAAKRSDPR